MTSHVVSTIIVAVGAAVIVVGLIGLVRPRMYESMMLRSAAKGPIPRMRQIAVIEVVAGVALVIVGLVVPIA